MPPSTTNQVTGIRQDLTSLKQGLCLTSITGVADDACSLAGSAPCSKGTCLNDGAGSYGCICPVGYVTGATPTGKATCVPGEPPGLRALYIALNGT